MGREVELEKLLAMKTTYSLLLSLVIFVLSAEIQARPFIFNFDTIYANADFCDRVEIINYDTTLHIISVKSNLDSLTYSFNVGGFNIKAFSNNKNDYLLIRGKPSSSINDDRRIVAIGILKDGKWVFNKMQLWGWGACFISSSNPLAEIENKNNQLSGKISYPKKYFEYKTPSITWTNEERESFRSLFDKGTFKIIHFDTLGNRYFNDTLYIKKTVIDSKHIVLMINITKMTNSNQDCHNYMKTLLASLELPYEKILENSEKSTEEWRYGEYMSSYSNSTYKLIIYTSHGNSRNEEISFLDLYLK